MYVVRFRVESKRVAYYEMNVWRDPATLNTDLILEKFVELYKSGDGYQVSEEEVETDVEIVDWTWDEGDDR